MKFADTDSTMKGFIIKPISMKLGSQTFKELLYVVPISNGMLARPTVARVITIQRPVIPPYTAIRLKCALSSKLETDYYFQPNEDVKLVAPRVIRKKGEDPIVCLVNLTGNYQTLKQSKLIGHAFACTTMDDSGEYGGSQEDDMAQDNSGMFSHSKEYSAVTEKNTSSLFSHPSKTVLQTLQQF
ncbi:hypothetical protein DPMN_169712 [Dreissena polymorpha]|uniref:Uncharacterized protein n=1 Tax=Dreissena polymorpha TaxID=45954 RepID=A0A9D4ICI2_DREPO|nr:hypothetical protein DPMN_169712 [Dreissena polymorpha]